VTSAFSVVIPTFERPDTLFQVLDALGRQESPPDFEVVVVDDGSGGETPERLGAYRAAYPLRRFRQDNAGPAAARNRGVREARGERILFLGDDTVPEPALLAVHARAHAEPRSFPAAVLGYTTWPGDRRVSPFLHHINEYGLQFGYGLIEDPDEVPFNFFYTSNISIDRRLLAENPFDTTFPSAAWEDIELAYRLEARGLKIRYNAKAVTRHYHPMNVDSFARRQYTVGKSGAIFYRKHPELGHFLGVHELESRRLADERQLARLRRRAHLGERFRFLASNDVFEKLMREHYLRGLRDGLHHS